MQHFENALGITAVVLVFAFIIGLIYEMRKEFWEDVCSMAQSTAPYALVILGVFGAIMGVGFALVTLGGTIPSLLGIGEWMPNATLAGKIMVYSAPLTSLGGWMMFYWAERLYKRRAYWTSSA